MGCCASTQAGDDGQSSPQPAREQQQVSSAPSLTSPLPPVTSTSPRTFAARSGRAEAPSLIDSNTLPPPTSSAAALVQPTTPTFERYSAPLRSPPRWTSKDRKWTPSQITRERAEFFDTRVTNRPETWSMLRNVCELVRSGDLATAQGILDASGCTLPTGSLADGCYDEAGNLYRIPELMVSDPTNVDRDTVEEDQGPARIIRGSSRGSNNIDGDTMIGVAEIKAEGARAIEKTSDADEEVERDAGDDKTHHGSDESLDRRREEKGKASERDGVRVRCRLSDRGGPDISILVSKTQHAASLSRKIQAEGKIQPPLRIRLAYLGHILDEKKTLEAQGWKEGHVINALVVGA